MTKSITLRLPHDEYAAFDAVCNERGYSKTGKTREFIRNMVKEELEPATLSAQEWKGIAGAIREIERGDYVPFEELKRGISKRTLVHNKSCR
jgi:predicted transcriptional regulator